MENENGANFNLAKSFVSSMNDEGVKKAIVGIRDKLAEGEPSEAARILCKARDNLDLIERSVSEMLKKIEENAPSAEYDEQALANARIFFPDMLASVAKSREMLNVWDEIIIKAAQGQDGGPDDVLVSQTKQVVALSKENDELKEKLRASEWENTELCIQVLELRGRMKNISLLLGGINETPFRANPEQKKAKRCSFKNCSHPAEYGIGASKKIVLCDFCETYVCIKDHCYVLEEREYDSDLGHYDDGNRVEDLSARYQCIECAAK